MSGRLHPPSVDPGEVQYRISLPPERVVVDDLRISHADNEDNGADGEVDAQELLHFALRFAASL
jgi:hypothetical protein